MKYNEQTLHQRQRCQYENDNCVNLSRITRDYDMKKSSEVIAIYSGFLLYCNTGPMKNGSYWASTKNSLQLIELLRGCDM